jgi:superfamily II DNA or RNA helicase
MLARYLTTSVPQPIRAKGFRYHRMGAVVAISGAEWAAHAVVRGGRNYRVEIVRDREAFRASCDCAYFTDRGQVCKHIWAAIIEADDRSLLSGNGEPTEDAFLEADVGRSGNRKRPSPPVMLQKAPPPWQRFLNDLNQRLNTGERLGTTRRFVEGEILYAIDVPQTKAGRGVVLHVLHRTRRKNGDWAKPKPAAVSPQEVDDLPDVEDREIHAQLLGAVDQAALQSTYYGQIQAERATYLLVNSPAARLLPRLVQTGRLHLTLERGVPESEALVWDDGPAWRFDLAIRTEPDGGLRVDGSLRRDGETMDLKEPVLLLQAGFLVTRVSVARFDPGEAFAWIMELRRASTVSFPASAADSLAEALARAGVRPDQLPERLQYEVQATAPQPSVKLARNGARYADGFRDTLGAVLRFDYTGTSVEPGGGSGVYDAAHRRLIRRDLAAEQRAFNRLRQLGFQQGWDYAYGKTTLSIPVDLFPRAVRSLVSEGWRVEAEGRLFRAPRDMQMRVSSGVDWFELHARVDFGDDVSANLQELLAALHRGEGTVLLDDGTRGLVPEEWLKRYAGVARFGEVDGDHVRFRPSQTALLDALLASQPAIAVDEAFNRARVALNSFTGVVPLEAPPTFTGTLRDYQRDALGWFAFLRQFGFGGCLADDMGLGKTVMVIALLEARRLARVEAGDDHQPSLAVLPRSLVFNWMEEASRFAPDLSVLDATGAARDLTRVEGHDLVLATYGTLRRDIAVLKDVEFDYVILDEAQAVKNPATAASKSVRLLKGLHRLALSGTPIENHLGELWSLFEFLNPGFLGSASAFKAAAIGRPQSEPEELAILARAVRPFILRRTKEQVAPELPERSEQTIQCELEGPQRRLYEQLRAHYRQTLLARISKSGINKSKIQVLEALLRLRQAACHPALVDDARRGESSAKLDVLLPRLTEVVAEGHKALVFSQFTSFLALVRSRLEAEGITYEYLDGQTRERAVPVARFQEDPSCPVFLISLKAGGLGLNLTAAEYVFLLDPWWNPAVEAQAIDRAHRIGQERHVFAYRLIAKDTVEEKVAELQQSKRDLADAILSADAGLIRDLKAEDVEWLLS